jgi:hypothetical protein
MSLLFKISLASQVHMPVQNDGSVVGESHGAISSR